jgi:hypothetical protein
VYSVFNKYYAKTNDFTLYATALILNPTYNVKYIKDNWEAKWVRPTLRNVEKLWETYQEEAYGPSIIPSYGAPLTKKPLEKELDVFDQIAQGLKKHT